MTRSYLMCLTLLVVSMYSTWCQQKPCRGEGPSVLNNHLWAKLVANPVKVQTGETSVRYAELSCGKFRTRGRPPVSVIWTTPFGNKLPSSWYDNGVFHLILDPVETGYYSCRVNSTDPALDCLDPNSDLRLKAGVYVDGVAVRLMILEARSAELENYNAELKAENAELKAAVADLNSTDADLKATDADLNTTDAELKTAVADLKAAHAKLTKMNLDDCTRCPRVSGVYVLRVLDELIPVYCDQDNGGGGWTVIQRRQDGSVDFYRNWTDYEKGFGNVTGEFWLGLRQIYHITSSRNYSLRVDLEDFYDSKAYAEYRDFRISGPDDLYRLHISGYSNTSTAGDDMVLTYLPLNNMQFSTPDQDNDAWEEGHCAQSRHGAWWYNACTNANLNGRYKADGGIGGDGIRWYHWKNNSRSMKRVEMKIRPRR